MKSFILLTYLANRKSRRNLMILVRLMLGFLGLVAAYSILFHYIMAYEGQQHSWITGIYWTMVVMSTLGFGDITFVSDLGRAFSVIVLLSGTVYMLILLPFTFIQFFYMPWMEAQAQARAPRELPRSTTGHVVLTNLSALDAALIRRLNRAHVPYVVVVSDLVEALALHDQGYSVMLGDNDDPDTYRRLHIENAALVATTRSDMTNTNITFTVREVSPTVPIVATCSFEASVDNLQLAGCNRVLKLGEMLGQALARRVVGRDAKSRVIGQFDDLLVAEAAVANTPLVGRTLREIRLPDHASVSVVGKWDRGRFEIAGPDTLITATSILLLAGSRSQLDSYDALFCIYHAPEAPVIIIGGGRVGRAAGKALQDEGIDYRIIERMPARIRDPQKYVEGDAAEIEVLEAAGLSKSSAVIITTHDDDMNVYLTIYCRRLRPNIQILGRANLERNVSTLHRAGADFVLSYSSMGANAIFNLLKRMDTLFLAEGLSVFKVPVPSSMAGRSLAQCGLRQRTGCNVIAISQGDQLDINPDSLTPLPAGADLILIGGAEAEQQFLDRVQ